MRSPGIAPGLPPWREVFGILLLNHNRESKRAGNICVPGPAISTKNKHLLAIYSIPTRGFTAAVSVFRGTPPTKPLICKSQIRLSRASFWSWADPTGEASLLVLAKFNLSPEDITWMSCYSYSQILYHLSLLVSIHALQRNKKPCLRFVSRVGKVQIENLPAYRQSIQITFGLFPDRGQG